VAAPQWAALIAIADQGRALAGQTSLDGISQTLPKIYQLPSSDFHDITSGSNGSYSAGPGYDLVTGRGSPYANLIVPALIDPSPVITSPATASPNPATVNVSIAFSVAASDADGDTLTYSWAFGDQGTATGATATHVYTASGTYIATATVTDGNGYTLTSLVNVTINPTPAITSASPLAIPVGVSYSSQLTVSGGTAPFAWSIVAGSGSLPAGMVLSPAGVLSGTPTTVGVSNFTIKVQDSLLVNATKSFSVTVNPTISAVTVTPNPATTNVSTTFSATASAPGISPTYAWNFGDGTTSGPLTVNTTTHAFAATGSYDVTVTVRNSSVSTFGTVLVTVADPGLVGCWKLNDGSGAVAVDSSGYGHDGALTNGPQWKEDTFGWDVQFNGGNQTIVANGVGVNTAAGGSNTVAFWMNWGGGDVQMPFGWNANYDLFLYKGYLESIREMRMCWVSRRRV